MCGLCCAAVSQKLIDIYNHDGYSHIPVIGLDSACLLTFSFMCLLSFFLFLNFIICVVSLWNWILLPGYTDRVTLSAKPSCWPPVLFKNVAALGLEKYFGMCVHKSHHTETQIFFKATCD